MSPATAADSFAARLLNWHAHHGRHDLPWQHPRTPYRVWLSEVMLQQTQVAVVIPYFQRFVTALPTLAALAEAGEDAVLGLWSGLGYYSRARNLHKAAKLCMQLHDGELPRSFDALLTLPGIGRSTAGAILSQAWGERFAILDGNVKRVLARYFGVEGWPGTPAVETRLWALAESLLPDSNLPAWTQAQMDLGATLCTRARPACALCPVQADCVARIEGRTSELPTPRPAKASPQREAWVAWLEDAQGEVLMQRRPERGVWAKLYSLPQFDSHDATSTWLSMQAANVRIETLAPIEHAFSHYRLRLQPLRAVLATPRPAALRENDETCWVPRARLAQLGIPAPIRRLIEPTQLRSTRMSRTVFCQRLNRESEGLEFAPLPGELGQRIYQHTSRDAWGEWLAHQTMLINELRLSPRNPEHRARLEAELVKFLFEGGAKTPAGFVSA